MTKTQQSASVWAGKDHILRFQITGSDGAAQTMDTASWVLFDDQTSACITVQTAASITGSLIDIRVGASDTASRIGKYRHQLAGIVSGSVAMLAEGELRILRSHI